MPDYGAPGYWDERYATETDFDWYLSFRHLPTQRATTPHIHKSWEG